MSYDLEYIRDKMASLNNDSLILILTDDAQDYEPEALQIAREELKNREISIDHYLLKKRFKYLINFSDISMSDLIPFRDIVTQIDYNLVEKIIFDIYPNEKQFQDEYNKFYCKLVNLEDATIKETCNESVLLVIDKQVVEMDDIPVDIWSITGLGTETGSSLNLELFNWNDWLSFYVNAKDIQKYSMERYIAHCFYKMNINGFSETDIKNNLKIKFEENNYYRFLSNVSTPDYSGAEVYNVIKMAQEFKTNIVTGEISQIRPWVRLWARISDSIIVSIIFIFLLKFLIPSLWGLQIIGILGIIITQIVIESILLSTWGTTPGKWILNVKLRDLNGNKLSFKKSLYRSIMVQLLGTAANLNNILIILASLAAYFRLKNIGITYWDEKGQFFVSHSKIGIFRIIIMVVLLFATPLILMILLYTK